MATTPKVPGAINVTPPLTGLEIVAIATAGAQSSQTTTQAIANLAGGGGAGEQTINTSITTVGNGTLTGAAIAGGVITRSGSVAAYTDTTDTAALIVAAISNAFVGQSFFVRIKNSTAFAETLAAGSGVTFSGVVIIPANSVGLYLVTLTSLTAVSLLHISTVQYSSSMAEVVTTLASPAGSTITGTGIAGGVTARSGTSADFTDTTDTATAIIAARLNVRIGQSWEYTYYNTTAFVATFAAGSGVTLSGVGSVGTPASSWVRFLVTYTAAGTITMAGISAGRTFVSNNEVLNSLNTVGGTSITAARLTGSIVVRGGSQSSTPFTDTTIIATSLIAALPNVGVGYSYEWTYQNTTNAVATLAGNTGLTLSGITVVPPGSWARYLITVATATTVTMVGFSSGVITTNSGTFVANGATPVTVANAAITVNSQVLITLKTVGGTVGACPPIQTITAGTGFTVAATAGDTSTYNYLILT